jgi:hypothetical protein
VVKYLRIGITAVLIAGTAGGPAAQAPATVAERIRSAMVAQEPNWRLDDTAIEDERFWHEWKNGTERISIEYAEHPTDLDASAWLRALPGKLPVPGEEPLIGVGDEALIWARPSIPGIATIRFRKARYIAGVTAPSKAAALRIAKLVLEQIYE